MRTIPRTRLLGIIAAIALVVIVLGATAAILVRLSSPPDAGTPPSGPTTAGAQGTPGESTPEQIVVKGVTRTFLLYRPAKPANPAPVVVVLHGNGGDGASMEQNTTWNVQADRDGLVVVYFDGLHRGLNAGTCCGAASRNNVDDVGAILAVLDDVGRRLPTDAKRTYASGFSNGGMMAYRLACDTDRFAAIGPVSGSLVTPCNKPVHASVLHLQEVLAQFFGAHHR